MKPKIPKSFSDFKKSFFPKNPSVETLKEKLELYVKNEEYEKAEFIKLWLKDYEDLGILE